MTDGAAKQYQISSNKEGYANQPVRCSQMQRKYSIIIIIIIFIEDQIRRV
jgi:hypothetical protein